MTKDEVDQLLAASRVVMRAASKLGVSLAALAAQQQAAAAEGREFSLQDLEALKYRDGAAQAIDSLQAAIDAANGE